MPKSSDSAANSRKSNPYEDAWTAGMSPAERRTDAAHKKPAPPPEPRICGLCDKDAPYLMRMQKFDKTGYLWACSICLGELTGRRGMEDV